MLVAVGLFAVIMTLALGALLVLSDADRKAEALKSSIDNVSFTLDSMSRAIRTGSKYHCGLPVVSLSTITPQDCRTGANYFAFVASDGSLIEYGYDPSCTAQSCFIGERITPVNGPSSGELPMTSSNVLINDGSNLFYTIGTTPGDATQPKVTILIHASVIGDATSTAVFNLQTSIAQRLYDK